MENAFGIMSAKFHALRCPILLPPFNADLAVQARTILHNYCRFHSSENKRSIVDYESEDGMVHSGLWRRDGNDSNRMTNLKGKLQ